MLQDAVSERLHVYTMQPLLNLPSSNFISLSTLNYYSSAATVA